MNPIKTNFEIDGFEYITVGANYIEFKHQNVEGSIIIADFDSFDFNPYLEISLKCSCGLESIARYHDESFHPTIQKHLTKEKIGFFLSCNNCENPLQYFEISGEPYEKFMKYYEIYHEKDFKKYLNKVRD